jgi:hypothetical protein
VSFILAGLIVAGASGGAMAVGRWLSRKRDDGPAPDAGAPEAKPKATTEAAAKDASAQKDDAPVDGAGKKGRPRMRTAEGPQAHLDGFPCQLGDVVMRLTGEEAWLAGGLVLSEDAPVAALFVAPEAVQDCAIYARPAPREALFWLAPLDPGAVLVGGEPPTSVEHGGIRFERVRRLPLRPKRIGTGAPDVGDAVLLAEYASSGAERLLVMRSTSGVSHAFRGLELEPSSYEVIASGRSTLG